MELEVDSRYVANVPTTYDALVLVDVDVDEEEGEGGSPVPW